MAQAKTVILAAVAAAAIGAAAQAGPDQVSFLLGSHHVNATRQYEEFNPGIVLTWTEVALDNTLDLGFGFYRNSYGDGSVVGLTALPLARSETWGIDLFGALAWYPGNGNQFSYAAGDIVPMAGIQGRYRNVFVQAIPGGGNTVDATLTFGLTFKVGS